MKILNLVMYLIFYCVIPEFEEDSVVLCFKYVIPDDSFWKLGWDPEVIRWLSIFIRI